MSFDDRLKKAIRSIIAELFPREKYKGLFRYSLVSTDGKVADCKLLDKSLGLPDFVRIAFGPSLLCEITKMKTGSIVHVMFADYDPANPVIVGGDPNAIPDEAHIDAKNLLELGATVSAAKLATAADTVDIGGAGSATTLAGVSVTIAGGVLGVARMTDPVIAGPFAGTITMGSTKVKAG